jgi:hypothetical protein
MKKWTRFWFETVYEIPLENRRHSRGYFIRRKLDTTNKREQSPLIENHLRGSGVKDAGQSSSLKMKS